ncbi:hypothetical protein FLGSB24_37060 [Flavobacterium sp. GSB-24]|nr:hypothetical protein FLGSB24_37060 [Flavobacterium sp. GSB-24]
MKKPVFYLIFVTLMIARSTNRLCIYLAHAPVEGFIYSMLFLLFTAGLGCYTIFKKIDFKLEKLVLIT